VVFVAAREKHGPRSIPDRPVCALRTVWRRVP
jgi:hypothetical protein